MISQFCFAMAPSVKSVKRSTPSKPAREVPAFPDVKRLLKKPSPMKSMKVSSTYEAGVRTSTKWKKGDRKREKFSINHSQPFVVKAHYVVECIGENSFKVLKRVQRGRLFVVQ